LVCVLLLATVGLPSSAAGQPAAATAVGQATASAADPPAAAAKNPAGPAPTPTAKNEPVRPFFFGEIVVVDEDDEPPPGTVDVLDASAIEAAGVVTVGEALQLMPGVSMSVGGRDEQKVWVRGYEQSNVLLLVDGVPVSDPYYGDLDLGQLPIFDVARITVTRGAASPLYGPNGLAGVINVTTMQGGESRRIAGDLRLTEQNTVLAHAGAGGGGDKLSWYLSLGSESSDGWPLSDSFEPKSFEEGGVRVNSDFSRASALARVGWRLGDERTLYASLRWIDAEKGIPFHTTEPAGFIKFARFPEWRQATAAVGYEQALAGGELRAQLYGHGFENTLDVYSDPELEQLRLSSSFSDRVYGGYAVGEWSLGDRHLLGAALHLRRDRHTKVERFPDGTQDPDETYVAWTSSLSVEDRWHLGDRTSLIGSLALERLDGQQATSLRDGVLVDEPLPTDTLLSPQLEVQRSLAGGWSLTAAAYRRARFPTMNQLYGAFLPNPELGPQRTTGVDFGAAWSSAGGLTARGTVFFNRVDDLISRRGRDYPYENQDEARIDGVELRLQGSSRVFEYGVSWTGLDHRFTSSSEGLEEIPYVPNHQVELLGVAHLGKRIDLRAVWLAVGRRVSYDRGDRREHDAYSLVNLGLTGRVGKVELTAQADNVFDADIEQEYGYPLPGRRLWIGCKFALQP
jgi:iron complex outermembrane receptor protein